MMICEYYANMLLTRHPTEDDEDAIDVKPIVDAHLLEMSM